MKSLITTIGIILILIGILIVAYPKISYTEQEKVAEIGPVKILADKKKAISLSPIGGGVAIFVGLVLVVIGRKK